MRSWTILGLSVLALAGCERLMSAAEVRASRARSGTGPALIGLVWPSTVSRGFDPGLSFWDGADLALEAVRGDAKLPRPLEVVRLHEDGGLLRSREVAQELAENLDVVAMIGHREAESARMASLMYEDAGLLMLAAGSANRGLDRAGFVRTFRLMPTDEELATALADVAHAARLSPVLIVYANDAHGRAVANAFESRAESIGLRILDRVPFETGAYRALEQSLSDAKPGQPGAIVLAERLPAAADVLDRIRKVGLSAPVLGTDDLDSTGLLPLPAADGALVATPFVAEASPDQEWVAAFKTKYGRLPDTWAAQGYYGVRLIADAMIRAGSAEPARVSEALRAPEARVRFGPQGQPLGRAPVIKRVQHHRFVGGAAAGRGRED